MQPNLKIAKVGYYQKMYSSKGFLGFVEHLREFKEGGFDSGKAIGMVTGPILASETFCISQLSYKINEQQK